MRGLFLFLAIPFGLTIVLFVLFIHGREYVFENYFELFFKLVIILLPIYFIDGNNLWNKYYDQMFKISTINKSSQIDILAVDKDDKINVIYEDDNRCVEIVGEKIIISTLEKRKIEDKIKTADLLEIKSGLEELQDIKDISSDLVPKREILEVHNKLHVQKPEVKSRKGISIGKNDRLFSPINKVVKITDSKEVGELGEAIAYKFEFERLKKIRKDLVNNLLYVGNRRGLGYDIESWDKNKKVFIEVKTTTDDFYSMLILTANEYKMMNLHPDTFYLYRIYNFNSITQEGKLCILKGKSEIEKYFDFQIKSFALRLNKTDLN